MPNLVATAAHELDTTVVVAAIAVAYMKESIEACCHPDRLSWPLRRASAFIQDVPEGETPRLQVGIIGQGSIGEAELVGIGKEELPITSPTIGQSNHDATTRYRHEALTRVLQSHIAAVVNHPTLRD